MSGLVHRIYIGVFIAIGFITMVLLIFWGYSYYNTSFEQRPFHPEHTLLKPSGPMGHGLGILGTLLILIGVFSYIGRKKNKFLPRVGALKYWLEFHIFLCSVGPLLILFHTAFKFGGIVSISFWSMVAVVLSGIIGRFVYLQIPRTIQGRELSLAEIKDIKDNMSQNLRTQYGLDDLTYKQLIGATQRKNEIVQAGFTGSLTQQFQNNLEVKYKIKSILKQTNLTGKDKREIINVVKSEMSLNAKINRLQTMQKLFKYWHV